MHPRNLEDSVSNVFLEVKALYGISVAVAVIAEGSKSLEASYMA